MDDQRAFSARISVDAVDDRRHELVVSSPAREECRVPCMLGATQVREQREILRSALEDVKRTVGAAVDGVDIVQAGKALREMNERSLTVTWQLFRGKCREVEAAMRRCCIGWSLETEKPPVVAAAAHLEQLVPIELLPLFDVSDWPETESYADLVKAVRRFPAFSTVVRREIPEASLSQDLVLANEPRLPIKCFSDSALSGAMSEASFFRHAAQWFDLEGPWPNRKLPHSEFVCRIARHLRDPRRRFDGRFRSSDQVQHFACHCDTRAPRSSDARLRLSHGQEVTIRELQARFAALASQSGDSSPRPLLFVNACGSSEIDPTGVSSFLRFFLIENQNRGFIGTETRVPDGFAAAFSKVFYSELLCGLPLGEAVHAAKWTLLKRHLNPLGILYTIYADPDLRVRKPNARTK